LWAAAVAARTHRRLKVVVAVVVAAAVAVAAAEVDQRSIQIFPSQYLLRVAQAEFVRRFQSQY